MKDEYIYCALNDCNINNGYSKCCLYCNDTGCPDRCSKKNNIYCHCLMFNDGIKRIKRGKRCKQQMKWQFLNLLLV